jgi:iron-sulfur cluster insertion protein
MIKITPKAAAKILELMGYEPSGSCLRLTVHSSGCCSGASYELSIGSEGFDDKTFESNGAKVLVGPGSLAFIRDLEIDYISHNSSDGFTIRERQLAECNCNGHKNLS